MSTTLALNPQEIGGGARWTIGVPHTQEVDSSFSIDEDTAIVCTAPVLSPTTVNTWICELFEGTGSGEVDGEGPGGGGD